MDYSTFIIMLARQRSGTNAMRSVLDAHLEIFCTPEIFHATPSANAHLEMETSYFEFLERHTEGAIKGVLMSHATQERVLLDYLSYLRCFSDKRYVLLDVKYNQTHHFDGPGRELSAPPRLFHYVKRHGLRVLNLTRHNYLRFYLSTVKANMTRQFTAYDESVVGHEPWYTVSEAESPDGDPKVTVPPDKLLYTLELCRSESEVVDRNFGHYGLALNVEYEDLFPELGGPPSDEELARIAKWLGVDPDFPAKRPKYRKQAVHPLHETIENYDEIATALRGTPFEYCLEDERMYRESRPDQSSPASRRAAGR